MKVSIDGILGSAEKIKSQTKLDEEHLNSGKKEIKKDSIAIENRINSRLDRIEKDFRELQSSLTRNQILKDGVNQLRDDLARGGQRQRDILNEIKFEGKNILYNFVGDSITESILHHKDDLVNESIQGDISKLKNLQVELDNIIASNLTEKEKSRSIQTDIESIFSKKIKGNLNTISSIKADTVMRLIK